MLENNLLMLCFKPYQLNLLSTDSIAILLVPDKTLYMDILQSIIKDEVVRIEDMG